MQKFWLFALLVLPAVIFTLDQGNKMVSFAEEDPLEDEADVEAEGDIEEVAVSNEDEGGEEDDEGKTTSSPDADTALLFVKPIPTGGQLEIPAGIPVEFLVGFRNKGKQDFIVETLDASFRYPMDFNFFIQNFSAITYNKVVPPEQEATFAYSFIPAENSAGRPFGLNINLAYKDAAGNTYQEAVFNETVQIVEIEEGLDGETFFLYLFMVAGVVLLLVIGQQTLLSFGKKRVTHHRKAAPVETGTSNPNNVDYEWLPKQTLATLNKEKSQKSPKATKGQAVKTQAVKKQAAKEQAAIRQSPRQRKAKRTTGSE